MWEFEEKAGHRRVFFPNFAHFFYSIDHRHQPQAQIDMFALMIGIGSPHANNFSHAEKYFPFPPQTQRKADGRGRTKYH
jgi:hypothetical protein